MFNRKENAYGYVKLWLILVDLQLHVGWYTNNEFEKGKHDKEDTDGCQYNTVFLLN